jgi:hypothetical protein
MQTKCSAAAPWQGGTTVNQLNLSWSNINPTIPTPTGFKVAIYLKTQNLDTISAVYIVLLLFYWNIIFNLTQLNG